MKMLPAGVSWLLFGVLLCAKSSAGSTAASQGDRNAHPEVITAYGRLRGKVTAVEGTDQLVNVFLGIPFAKPPIGSLRFAPPQPPEPWSHVRDATSFSPACLQDTEWYDMFQKFMNTTLPDLRVSEDCLYLNIFTPNTKGQLPVMVWIHGGALKLGGASIYDGSALSAYEDVVVVSIHYRLDILGFFSTGSAEARGNWGLLDQTAALQWVQENIKSFGGDPECVTIFGESAGGFSVSAQILSPLSKGLFHRAIAESGVVQLPILWTPDPEALSKEIAVVSGCGTNSAEMVHCLRNKTEQELMSLMKVGESHKGVLTPNRINRNTVPRNLIAKSINELIRGLSHGENVQLQDWGNGKILPTIQQGNVDTLFTMKPLTLHGKKMFVYIHPAGGSEVTTSMYAVVDGEFFPKAPEELLAAKEFHDVPYLLGVNNDEYGWTIPLVLYSLDIKDGINRENITAAFQPIASMLGLSPEAVEKILAEYLGDTEDLIKLRDAFRDLMGDAVFVVPAVETARSHRDSGAPVYFYEFQHRPSTFKDIKPDFVKADHGDEMNFVFGFAFLNGTSGFMGNGEIAEDEKQLSKTIMKYWANFARTGNPNGKGLVKWPRYDQNERYLELNLQQQEAEKLKNKWVDIWAGILHGKMKRTTEKEPHVEL